MKKQEKTRKNKKKQVKKKKKNVTVLYCVQLYTVPRYGRTRNFFVTHEKAQAVPG